MAERNIGDVFGERLSGWLMNKLPDAKSLKISDFTTPSGMGWSVEIVFFELEYSLGGQVIQQQCVLRRDAEHSPLILGTDLVRQAEAMQYIMHQSTLPVPQVIGVESSSEIIGAPFMVMLRMDGRSVQQNPNYNTQGWVYELPEANRAKLWTSGVCAIAQLHRLKANDSLSFLRQSQSGIAGLPQYLEWVREWYAWAVQGRKIPVAEAALDYLFKFMPANTTNSVLWGDPTPANCLFDDESNLVGLLDWELAGMGPGEIDLAWWLFMDQLMSEGLGYTRLAGLPSRQELIKCYENVAGRKVDNIEYYEVLSGLKMALVTLRSVDRSIESGRLELKWDNNAIRSNPSISLLAAKMGLEKAKNMDDFNVYISSLFA